jgi:RNA polymerase sigma factor (sigma-70 family)
MSSPQHDSVPLVQAGKLDLVALEQASIRASLLVAAGLPQQDREDFVQELEVDFVRRYRCFDATRGTWLGFVRRVMYHRSTQLAIAHQQRRNREVLAGDLQNSERTDDKHKGRQLRWAHAQPMSREMQLHVRRTLQSLPASQQLLASLLAAGYRMKEIAQCLGCSRSSVHRERQKLRNEFKLAGLGPKPK